MQFGSLGFPELLFLFVLVLIVFGPRRMPEIGRAIGKAMAELRKGTEEIKRAIEEEVGSENLRDAIPKEFREIREDLGRVGSEAREIDREIRREMDEAGRSPDAGEDAPASAPPRKEG